MAKREGSNPIGWLLIGVILGAVVVVALYFFLTRPAARQTPPEAAPSVKIAPPPLPPEPVTPIAPPPVAAPVKPPPAPTPTQRDQQIEDDAAATGMTGPARPPPAPAGDDTSASASRPTRFAEARRTGRPDSHRSPRRSRTDH